MKPSVVACVAGLVPAVMAMPGASKPRIDPDESEQDVFLPPVPPGMHPDSVPVLWIKNPPIELVDTPEDTKNKAASTIEEDDEAPITITITRPRGVCATTFPSTEDAWMVALGTLPTQVGEGSTTIPTPASDGKNSHQNHIQTTLSSPTFHRPQSSSVDVNQRQKNVSSEAKTVQFTSKKPLSVTKAQLAPSMPSLTKEPALRVSTPIPDRSQTRPAQRYTNSTTTISSYKMPQKTSVLHSETLVTHAEILPSESIPTEDTRISQSIGNRIAISTAPVMDHIAEITDEPSTAPDPHNAESTVNVEYPGTSAPTLHTNVEDDLEDLYSDELSSEPEPERQESITTNASETTASSHIPLSGPLGNISTGPHHSSFDRQQSVSSTQDILSDDLENDSDDFPMEESDSPSDEAPLLQITNDPSLSKTESTPNNTEMSLSDTETIPTNPPPSPDNAIPPSDAELPPPHRPELPQLVQPKPPTFTIPQSCQGVEGCEACVPRTYSCIDNLTTGQSGWRVCDVDSRWVFAGYCPESTVCKINEADWNPYCVPLEFRFHDLPRLQ